MREMRPIAIDDPVACQSVIFLRLAKTAKRIEVQFGMETIESPRNTAFGEGCYPPTAWGREWEKCCPLYTTVSIYSSDGATFEATIVK